MGRRKTTFLHTDREPKPADVDTAQFKQAARHFASGVTVVTTRCDELHHGGTVSAFFSLSLEPLQVLISLNSTGRLAELVEQSGIFAANVLSAEQESLSRLFASPQRPTSLGGLSCVESDVAATGAPIIRGCLAYFDCVVAEAIVAGDHTLFIGQVQAVSASDGQPLLYFDGAYRTLASAPVDPVNL
jgi:flavin reductase (DIM6/NTAB) family NADH-FMN oxidoreductase RutF